MATDILTAIASGDFGALSGATGGGSALSDISAGNFDPSSPQQNSDDDSDWWGKYWGHLKDQASAAYHAASRNEAASMPDTDPMTLTQLIAGRSNYLNDIDLGSDPNADSDTKDRAAISAKRLARIDQVLSLMAGQGPAEPMTDAKAADIVSGLNHEKLLASDRYKQVYDSTPPEMMSEDQRRAYARDVIAKEVNDLPWQRDSILAQLSGHDETKALESYGVNALPARQAEFYRQHGSDVPLPEDLSSTHPEVVDTSTPSTTPVMDNPVIGAATGVLNYLPGAKEFGERMIQGLGAAAAKTEEIGVRAVSTLSPILANDPDFQGALDDFHKTFVSGLAPHEAKTFSDKLADAPGQVLEIVAPALLAGPVGESMELPALGARSADALAPTMSEEAWAAIGDNILRNMPGAVAASVPIEKGRYDALIEQGATPAEAAINVAESAPQTIAQNLLPIAGSAESTLGRMAQGAGSQVALAGAQELAAGQPLDPAELTVAGLTGGGLAAAHVAGKPQTAADVVAARAGFQSADELAAATKAHGQWEGRFAKTLEQIGNDPEAKARADWALAQYHAGEKTGLWAQAELRHIADTGLSRDEEGYAAAQAAASPEAREMGVTPEGAAQERAEEVQAASDVFGDEQSYAAEQGMAEQRADDSLPETEGIEPSPMRYRLDDGEEAPLEPTAAEHATAEKISLGEPDELTEADLTPDERAAFERQRRPEVEQPQSVNASGESAASTEAIGRVAAEREAGQHRMLIERDGSVRPLIGVDAVDTHARPGQVIVQRGIGKEEWTVLSHGADLSPLGARARIHTARENLAEAVKEEEGGRETNGGRLGGAAGESEAPGVPQTETPGSAIRSRLAGEVAPRGVGVADEAAPASGEPVAALKQPTPRQIAARNYPHRKVRAHGVTVSIENEAGSVRSGVSPDGRRWSRTMNHPYGRALGTVGADGEHQDVILGDQPNNPNRKVFVIDQKGENGRFDEHKSLVGFRNQRAAEQAYLSEYPKGWQGMGRVREMTGEEWRTWLQGRGREEAQVGPVDERVPRVTLRHPQPDATVVHASAPTDGTSITATDAGVDGEPLSRLSLKNAGPQLRRRAIMQEVPRGAPVPEGHSSTVLRNVYDLDADPRNLMQRARAEVEKRSLPLDEDHVINEFERQVVANGFDGYSSEGHVTVLGHDVPVANGGEHEVAAVEEPRPAQEETVSAEEGEPERTAEAEPGDAGREGEGEGGDRVTKPETVKPAPYRGPGMSKDAVRGLLRLLRWEGAGSKTEVHQTEADLPPEVSSRVPLDYLGKVVGFYDGATGKVHIIADRMSSPIELYRTLTEEHLGHGGLRKIFNERDLNTFLDRAYRSISHHERLAIAQQYKPEKMSLGEFLSKPENRRLVAEEHLAKLEPTTDGKSLFERFHDWFNRTSRAMGRDVNYTPSELREIMRSAHDHVRAGLSPSHASRSPVDMVTPRFRLDGTFARTADTQISWEATPSETFDSETFHASYGRKLALQTAVADILRGKSGKDRIAEAFGLDIDGDIIGPGGWKGRVSPSTQARIRTIELTPENRTKLDNYARTLGLLLKQDGVAWHQPQVADSIDESNGIHLDLGRDLTPEEAGRLYDRVVELTQEREGITEEAAQQLAPIPAKNGVRFLNFDTVRDNAAFHAIIEDAASETLGNESADPYYFKSEGNLVENDWRIHPDGEDYKRALDDAGGLGTFRRLERELGPALEKALVRNDRAALRERKDRLAGKAGRSAGLDLGGDAGEVRRREADYATAPEGIDAPHYADRKPQHDAVSALGVHYSTTPGLSHLDASYAGTGSAGGERSRLGAGRYGEMDSRLYFYVQTGFDLPPKEPEVAGANIYRTRLDNLYDAANDPRGFREEVGRENNGVFNQSAFEELIREHGFDGFVDERPETGNFESPIAVLFGVRKKVPVDYLEGDKVPLRFRVGRVKGSPDQEAAMARTMSRPHEDTTLGDRARRWWRDFKDRDFADLRASWLQGWLDSGNQIARIEREVFGGFLADASESPYKMYNLARNSRAVMAATMKYGAPVYKDGAFQIDPSRKGIFDIFRPLYEHESGKTLMPLWEFYASARRASRLIKETNINGTLREKNFKQADIDEALKLEQQYPIFKKVADDWEKFNNQLLDLAVDRGAIGKEEADSWKQNFYVPFYRAMEELELTSAPRTRRGSAASNQKIYSRRLTGGENKVEDVFENILANTSYILDRTYRQEFMNRLLDMGEGVVLEKVPMAASPIRLQVGDLARALWKGGIISGTAVHGQKQSPHMTPPHWAFAEVERLSPAEKKQWTTVFQRVAPSDPDIVPIMRNGKMEYFRVTDPLLLRTIGAMGHDSFGTIVNLLGAGKRLMTWGVTKDPGFMAATWFRDALINWVGSHTPITPFVDNMTGALASIRNDPLVGQLMMAGVGVAPHYETQGPIVREQLRRKYASSGVLDGARKAFDFYNRVGIAAEASSRLAIAKQVLARGGSMAEAAYQSQDILNYSMRGDYVAARLLAQTAPFWNAGMQGLYRFIRGAGWSNFRAGDSSQLRSYILRGSAIVGASVFNAWRNKDDPRYNRLSEEVKDRYWHFYLQPPNPDDPTDDRGHYMLPKPFEAGVIFGTLPERFIQRLLGNDTTRDSTSAALRMALEEMRLNPLPQGIRQIAEQWANRDTSSGRSIVPESYMDQLPQDQFSPYTSETAKFVSQKVVPENLPWLNSPMRLQNLTRAIFGTIGSYTLRAADWLARESGAAPPAPTMRAQDIPVLSRFVGSGDRSRYEDKLYELRDEADKTFRSFQEAAKRGDQERVSELSTRPQFQYRRALDAMGRKVTMLRANEKRIMQNPFITPEEKRRQLDEANSARLRVLDEYAPFLNQLEGKF
jgi:hypothetical protein